MISIPRTHCRHIAFALGQVAFTVILLCSPGKVLSQIVQLPTTGSFSLQTSVLAPDSGSAYLGGNARSATGSKSLGPGSIASGLSETSAGASVRATIIDLNELDLMIRSQAGSKPTIPDLAENRSQPTKYATGQKGTPVHGAEYEYLLALSHANNTGVEHSLSDANYYLALARKAKLQRHWASVELYYKLAWESLPESRRETVLKNLAEVRRQEAEKKSNEKKSGVK